VLKSVIPGQVAIRPNAAVCLVLIGLSLWLLRKTNDRPVAGGRKLGGQLLAGLTAVVGLLNLTEYVFGWDLGIDQLLFQVTAADEMGSLRPGLMAPITALDFLLLGLALLGLDWTVAWRSRRYSPAQVFAVAAGIASIVGLLDFVLSSATSYTYIALQVAVILSLLSLGVACARTERGIAALIVSASVGGTLVRRVLSAAIVIPILIGALWWTALSDGFSSVWAGGTTMIVVMIASLGGLTVLIGFLIDRADVERRDTERTLHRREEELREAQCLARLGSWWWDPRTRNLVWSEELHRMAARHHAGHQRTQAGRGSAAAIGGRNSRSLQPCAVRLSLARSGRRICSDQRHRARMAGLCARRRDRETEVFGSPRSGKRQHLRGRVSATEGAGQCSRCRVRSGPRGRQHSAGAGQRDGGHRR